MKTIFPLKIYQWNAHWATNDIDIVLYNAVSREKNEFWSGRPLLDQDNNVIAAVVT
jgi:hypothetical protein